MELKIEWNMDFYDCDICGPIWATGVIVYLDGEIILNDPAHASCFDSNELDYEDVLKALCKKLEINVVDNNYDKFDEK